MPSKKPSCNQITDFFSHVPSELDGEEVLLLGVLFGHWPVAHANPLEHGAAHVEARGQDGAGANAVDGADEVAVDLALTQTRRVAPDVL